MEQLVWSFIDSMGRDTRDVLPLARLKEHDEYTFVHSINVCLLVLAQGRSFGIQGGMLHAMGMAALLHDVGKLMVPLAVLNKSGKLMAGEWELMKSHCEEGAWYLSGTEGVTPLSIVVAYEHHLRFDGAAQRGPASTALRVEGTVARPADSESWEYSMVLSIRNERGEEIDRKLVGVGAMRPGEQRTFSLAVEIYGADVGTPPRRH
jgi:hypothetical protein